MIKEKITEVFYGCYWPYDGSHAAIIAMLGDDCEDYMARRAVKWVQKRYGISVMTLSPSHKDYGHHNMPVERIGNAIKIYGKQRYKQIRHNRRIDNGNALFGCRILLP